MKKILIIAISLLLTTSLFAQTFRIATFPFTGSVVTNTAEGEFLAGLFTSEFIPLGYTLVTRTTGLGVSAAEREYQTSGATAEIAEIGKQVAADYVLVGALNHVFGQISLKVEVIGVESSQIVASQTKQIDSLDDITTASVEMVKTLNSQIKGTSLDTQITEVPKEVTAFGDFATLTPEEVIMQDLEKFKTGKWIGRWSWIGGAVTTTIGLIVMSSADSGGDYPEQPSQNDYKNPNWPYYDDAYYDDAAYEDAQDDYDAAKKAYEDAKDDYYAGMTTMIIGSAVIVAGVITDIVFSGRENKLLDGLESQGIYLSATPTIKPDLLSGNMNYGVQLAVKLSF